MPSAIIFGI